MDERAIIDHDWLLAGSVRANGNFRDSDLPGWGNVELSVYNLAKGKLEHVLLHERLEQDDHDAPGLLVLHDGRYLATYSKHRVEPRFWYRISSQPGDPLHWGPEVEVASPGFKGNFGLDNFTYCNPMMLANENHLIYLFHRGVSQNPNYLMSTDDGRTWKRGGMLFDGLHGYSPYVKYACNGKDTIHFVATEDHPRNFDNSLYHGFIRKGEIFKSDGKLVGPLATTTNTTIRPWDLTRIYQGGKTNVAWMTDIALDRKGNPAVLFTVQVDGANLPRGQGGMDHRFHLAFWDGKKWHEQEIACAGKRLYAGEDDYTGLGAIDPQNTSTVYISTDAEPRTGKPLVSQADGRRHHELFRGSATDGGHSWRWDAVTANSTMDNLRPIIPAWKSSSTALLWMRGEYRNNHGAWTTKVVLSILSRKSYQK
jgi:BNR repeat-containing family member